MRRTFLTRMLALPALGLTSAPRARGVLESDLAGKNATFANPTIFVGLVQWADKVLTE